MPAKATNHWTTFTWCENGVPTNYEIQLPEEALTAMAFLGSPYDVVAQRGRDLISRDKVRLYGPDNRFSGGAPTGGDWWFRTERVSMRLDGFRMFGEKQMAKGRW